MRWIIGVAPFWLSAVDKYITHSLVQLPRSLRLQQCRELGKTEISILYPSPAFPRITLYYLVRARRGSGDPGSLCQSFNSRRIPALVRFAHFYTFLFVVFFLLLFLFFLLFLFYFFILLWWGKVRERSPTSSEGEGRGGEWLRRYGGRSYRSGSTWLLLFTGNDEFIFKKIREGVSYYRLHCELVRAPFASGVSACLLARMPDRQTIRRSFSRRRS